MRDEFSPRTIETLGRRVGLRCSNPKCRKPTTGPHTDDNKVLNLGVASHITAAARGGPRYDPRLTSGERRSISNGIWLCQLCAKLVDNDESCFPEELLRKWKVAAEERAFAEATGAISPEAPTLEHLCEELRNASSVLLNWPSRLDDGHWIERPEVKQLIQWLDNETSDTVVVLGRPGSGKSALLSRFAHECISNGHMVLAIKADLLLPSVGDLEQLRTSLDFSIPVVDSIDAVGAAFPVVVVIDQLDALADLVDLNTERLNLLLNLVKRIRSSTRAKIVLSCRAFEYHHDARLTHLGADEVCLELPDWTEIQSILLARGIDAAHWPEECREVLRYPQNLKIFLQRLADTDDQAVFASYRELYDDLWARSISRVTGASLIVNDIAMEMATDETLWVASAKFHDQREIIQQLIANGILTCQGARIGFQHQTLFEHARARAFATSNVSLSKYSLERQDSLFVRPVIWATMGYLRDVALSKYCEELHAFLHGELRVHIRYLLVDFLAQQTPETFEFEFLVCQLNDESIRPKVLSAIAGSEPWFQALRKCFPRFMQLDAEEAWPMVRVLSEGLQFARQDVLDLIEKHWLPFPEKDAHSYRALDDNQEWEERLVDWHCKMFRRTNFDPFYVMEAARQISESKPESAPRVVADSLWRQLEKVLEESIEDVESPEGFPTDYGRRNCFTELLDQSGYHALQKVATAAPKQYLESIIPWFARVLEAAVRGTHVHVAVRQYRIDGSNATKFDRETGRDYSIVVALEQAVFELAKSDPDAFIDLTSPLRTLDSMAAQRLVARGFIACADTKPRECLIFLLEDPRRFLLGEYGRNDDSQRLISEVSAHLSVEQLRQLQHGILEWSQYRPGQAEGRQEFDIRSQNELLSNMPLDSLSIEIRERVRAAQKSLTNRYTTTPRMVRIDSPVSVDEMETSDNEEILELFDELVDKTGSSHPREWTWGGSVQASHQFAELAKRSPDRVAGMLTEFRPADQQRPVGEALEAIADTSYSTDRLVSLILELAVLGFGTDGLTASNEFRVSAARAIAKRTKAPAGLPDKICALFEQWLETPWGLENPEHQDADREPQPILWGSHSHCLPHTSYYALYALTYGYLLRESPNYDAWLDMLERHLEREEPVDSWLALSDDLRWLVNADPARVDTILNALFTKYPRVRDSVEGVILVAMLWPKLPESRIRQFLSDYTRTSWQHGLQAYGELVSTGGIRPRGHEWVIEELDKILGNVAAANENLLTGVGFSAARLWDEPDAHDKASNVLTSLAISHSAMVADSVMDVFFLIEELPADEHTTRLLTAVSENPKLLENRHVDYLVDRLADLLPFEPELIYRISKQILELRGHELRSIQYALVACSGAFVSIALTIQRLGGEFRAKGLELFEQLMELGISDAQSAINQLDRNPLNAPPPYRRPRRAR